MDERRDTVKYRQIKWLILLLPTLTIALWEYVRHAFLLPYISMDMGNVLSPLLVFFVTLVFVRYLFSILEKIQEELRQEKEKKAALIEREKLARELHDGIAQSLFLLSVKMNKFGRKNNLEQDPDFIRMKQTLQHVHDDTRQAITNLKHSPSDTSESWTESIHQYVDDLTHTHLLDVNLDWRLSETTLSRKEKNELFACVKEAAMNVIKHAKTNKIWITASETAGGWICEIIDFGIGFTSESLKAGLGLQIMKDRAKDMNWDFSIQRKQNQTTVSIKKEVT